MKNLFATCFALCLLSGCVTVDSLQPGPGGTNFTVKERSYDAVWTAAVHSVRRKLVIVEESKAKGEIRAQSSGTGLMPSGEVVGVFITPAGHDAPSYNIEVLSMKRAIGQQDWTRNIVAGIKAELGSRPTGSAVPVRESLSPSEEIVVLPESDHPAQPTGVKGGGTSAQVERLARQSGCVPAPSATLIAKTSSVETYQVSCQNGQQALFKCEMQQCRRVD